MIPFQKQLSIIFAYSAMGTAILNLNACKHTTSLKVQEITTKCDTTAVSYRKTIQPIIQKYCYGCHSGSGAINGYDFNDFTTFQNFAIDPERYVSNAMKIGTMPPINFARQDTCELNQVVAWVNQGCLNN